MNAALVSGAGFWMAILGALTWNGPLVILGAVICVGALWVAAGNGRDR